MMIHQITGSESYKNHTTVKSTMVQNSDKYVIFFSRKKNIGAKKSNSISERVIDTMKSGHFIRKLVPLHKVLGEIKCSKLVRRFAFIFLERSFPRRHTNTYRT